MRAFIGVFCVFALPFAVACASGPGDPTPKPSTQTQGVSPHTHLAVSVALAAAHLGDETCTHDEARGLTLQSCVMRAEDAGLPKGTGLCGGPCDYSNLQLVFTAMSGGAATAVRVVGATVVDAATGTDLQALTASTPLAWDGAAYADWNQVVAPSSTVKASYTLSPPAWSSFGMNTYSRQYLVRVVVDLDGAMVTLESGAISRDPPLAT